jgi:hypothetical protein
MNEKEGLETLSVAVNDDINARFEQIEARLARLEGGPKDRVKPKWSNDPKFPDILQRWMREQGLSQSDLAAKIWGRYTSTEGKFVAKGRDRISRWINGKEFPSKKNLALLAQFGVDIV